MPYPSSALREYALKTDLAALVLEGGGTPGPTGPQGPTGPTGATGAAGAPWTPVESATAPALASSGTITTASLTVSRVAPTGAVTGVIVASGTIAGQQIVVLNESAYDITCAAAGTSHVATGTGCVIAALTCRVMVWDSVTALWYANGAPSIVGGGTGSFDSGTFDSGTFDG